MTIHRHSPGCGQFLPFVIQLIISLRETFRESVQAEIKRGEAGSPLQKASIADLQHMVR